MPTNSHVIHISVVNVPLSVVIKIMWRLSFLIRRVKIMHIDYKLWGTFCYYYTALSRCNKNTCNMHKIQHFGVILLWILHAEGIWYCPAGNNWLFNGWIMPCSHKKTCPTWFIINTCIRIFPEKLAHIFCIHRSLCFAQSAISINKQHYCKDSVSSPFIFLHC